MNSNTAETSKFKSVSGRMEGEVRFIRPKQLADDKVTGIVAEGTYEGSQETDGKYGKQTSYKIRASNGDLLIVNAAGNLKYRMSQAIEAGLTEGLGIQVSYLGKNKMSDGPFKGTLAHNWDVLIESTDTDDAA